MNMATHQKPLMMESWASIIDLGVSVDHLGSVSCSSCSINFRCLIRNLQAEGKGIWNGCHRHSVTLWLLWLLWSCGSQIFKPLRVWVSFVPKEKHQELSYSILWDINSALMDRWDVPIASHRNQTKDVLGYVNVYIQQMVTRRCQNELMLDAGFLMCGA